MAKGIVICFALLLSSIGVHSHSTRDCVRECYWSLVGTVEDTNRNDGEVIGAILNEVGLSEGYDYCAATLAAVFNWCGVSHRINAWSPTAHNGKNIVYFKGKWEQEPLPADAITIWSYSKGRISHTGFYDSGKSTIGTVEGNVYENGLNVGKQGIFPRKRPIGTIYSITRWID